MMEELARIHGRWSDPPCCSPRRRTPSEQGIALQKFGTLDPRFERDEADVIEVHNAIATATRFWSERLVTCAYELRISWLAHRRVSRNCGHTPARYRPNDVSSLLGATASSPRKSP